MPWERLFKALQQVFSGARAREGAFSSPEDYAREIQRLREELAIVRAKREREKAEFLARHTILDRVSPHGGMPLEEVDRRLGNLQRIRDDRLKAEQEAYERQIRELDRQAQQLFGHS